MPDPALPQPWDNPKGTGLVHYQRIYQDVLRRPMQGHVMVIPMEQIKFGDMIYAPAKAPLVGGVLSVDLPPGRYELVASLLTIEQHRTSDTTQITLSAPN